MLDPTNVFAFNAMLAGQKPSARQAEFPLGGSAFAVQPHANSAFLLVVQPGRVHRSMPQPEDDPLLPL